MSKRDELIQKYAADLKEKCGVKADMDLLTKVTIGCGPSIYNADAATVSGSDDAELATVKNNFLIKKLGLKDSPDLGQQIPMKLGPINLTLPFAILFTSFSNLILSSIPVSLKPAE